MTTNGAEQAQLREMIDDAVGDIPIARDTDGTRERNAALWTTLGSELGLAALLIPEALGGVGADTQDVVVICRQLGKHLVTGRFYSSAVVATSALLEFAEDANVAQCLGVLAEGESTATVALTDSSGERTSFDGVEVVGEQVTANVRGVKELVLDASTARYILVAARREGTPVLCLVDTTSGVGRIEIEDRESLDLTQSLSRVEFVDAAATVIASGDSAAALLRRGLDRAMVFVAALQAGGTRACLEETVDYSRLREQFGRPISGFQAVRHKLADMCVRAETSEAVVDYVSSNLDSPDVDELVSVMRVHCSEAYLDNAFEMMQLHGGIGFTWEHDAHLHLRRAQSDANLFDGPPTFLNRIAATLEDSYDD